MRIALLLVLSVFSFKVFALNVFACEPEWASLAQELGGDKVSAGVIVAALVGIAITAAAIFGSFYKVTSPTLLAPWSAVIWFAIGLVYMALVKGREPASDALADLRT